MIEDTNFLLMLACWFCSGVCLIFAHFGNWLPNSESLGMGFANYLTLPWSSFMIGVTLIEFETNSSICWAMLSKWKLKNSSLFYAFDGGINFCILRDCVRRDFH